MPTLNEVAAALKRHVGLTQSKTFATARRLREAGMFPAGAPGISPEVSLSGALDLVVGVVASGRVYQAPEVLQRFKSMSPGGADLSAAPEHLRATAGAQLTAIGELMIEGDDAMRRLQLEFVASWPELAVHYEDGSIERFQQQGALPGHWQSTGHRTSTTINGAALANALKDLFA